MPIFSSTEKSCTPTGSSRVRNKRAHQHQADKRRPLAKIAGEEHPPVPLHGAAHRRVAIAGEIGEQRAGRQAKEVDVLRPARRPADVREALALRKCVDRRGLARVRASRERDLGRAIARKLPPLRGGGHEFGAMKRMRHGVHALLAFARGGVFGRIQRLKMTTRPAEHALRAKSRSNQAREKR